MVGSPTGPAATDRGRRTTRGFLLASFRKDKRHTETFEQRGSAATRRWHNGGATTKPMDVAFAPRGVLAARQTRPRTINAPKRDRTAELADQHILRRGQSQGAKSPAQTSVGCECPGTGEFAPHWRRHVRLPPISVINSHRHRQQSAGGGGRRRVVSKHRIRHQCGDDPLNGIAWVPTPTANFGEFGPRASTNAKLGGRIMPRRIWRDAKGGRRGNALGANAQGPRRQRDRGRQCVSIGPYFAPTATGTGAIAICGAVSKSAATSAIR